MKPLTEKGAVAWAKHALEQYAGLDIDPTCAARFIVAHHGTAKDKAWLARRDRERRKADASYEAAPDGV